MKLARQIFILVLCCACLGQVPAKGEGDSQGDLNVEAGAKAKYADAQMGLVYREIIRRFSEGADAKPALVGRIRKSQRAWIAFRDAQIEALYPSDEHYSLLPMCVAIELQQLTEARTVQLRQWLDGTEEGDVCAGSRPLK